VGRRLDEVKCAIEHENLDEAITAARDFARQRGHPIPLKLAATFLPVIVRQSPSEYDSYALRFFGRWISEGKGRTIDEAADVAAALAELPENPTVELPL
jgi:hypothetical protein